LPIYTHNLVPQGTAVCDPTSKSQFSRPWTFNIQIAGWRHESMKRLERTRCRLFSRRCNHSGVRLCSMESPWGLHHSFQPAERNRMKRPSSDGFSSNFQFLLGGSCWGSLLYENRERDRLSTYHASAASTFLDGIWSQVHGSMYDTSA